MSHLTTRFLANSDLAAYQALGARFFPNEDWDRGIQRVGRMISRWPEGIFGIWRDTELVGYITLYPITAAAAHDLEAGTVVDSQVDANLLSDEDELMHHHWITTSIVISVTEPVLRSFARDQIVNFLMSRAKANRPSEIYAHAVTEAGRRFCSRLGFEFRWPNDPTLCSLRRL